MLAVSDMMRVSLAQYAMTFFSVLVSVFFFGESGAWSAAIGGLAYAVPTTLLVAVLRLRKGAKGGAYAVLVGEFVRILAFGAVLVLAARVYEDLHWPSVLIGSVSVVSSYFVILFKKY